MDERDGAVAARLPWGVAALLLATGDTLAARFGSVTVRGELSGFSRAGSGHCYFALKDISGAPALLRCAMFRRAAVLSDFAPKRDENGKRNWLAALRMPQNVRLFGPRTLLNVAITNQRSFAGRTISLAETKMIGKTFGCTLNDGHGHHCGRNTSLSDEL